MNTIDAYDAFCKMLSVVNDVQDLSKVIGRMRDRGFDVKVIITPRGHGQSMMTKRPVQPASPEAVRLVESYVIHPNGEREAVASQVVVLGGTPCVGCGTMMDAGGCKPCPECGTMSGGCA
jgi:hypothetical protein